jgi:hypothetical protein
MDYFAKKNAINQRLYNSCGIILPCHPESCTLLRDLGNAEEASDVIFIKVILPLYSIVPRFLNRSSSFRNDKIEEGENIMTGLRQSS